MNYSERLRIMLCDRIEDRGRGQSGGHAEEDSRISGDAAIQSGTFRRKCAPHTGKKEERTHDEAMLKALTAISCPWPETSGR